MQFYRFPRVIWSFSEYNNIHTFMKTKSNKLCVRSNTKSWVTHDLVFINLWSMSQNDESKFTDSSLNCLINILDHCFGTLDHWNDSLLPMIKRCIQLYTQIFVSDPKIWGSLSLFWITEWLVWIARRLCRHTRSID